RRCGGGRGGRGGGGRGGPPGRSGRRNLLADFEASFCQPLFEQPKPVVTPEPFVREHEKGHAEHVVRDCLFLAALVGGPAFPSQIFEIVPVGQAKFHNQPSYGFRLIGFELAQKKLLEGQPATLRSPLPFTRSWNGIHRTRTSNRCPSAMPGSNARNAYGLLKSEYIFTSAFSLVWSGIMICRLSISRCRSYPMTGRHAVFFAFELIEGNTIPGFLHAATPHNEHALAGGEGANRACRPSVSRQNASNVAGLV